MQQKNKVHNNAIQIRVLDKINNSKLQELSDLLIDCVEGGASVNFMLPLSRTKAENFWHSIFSSVARCERVVIIAEDTTGTIIGSIQVVFAQPENQPHRADVSKLLVHRKARRRGVGAALLVAIERCALHAGKTLLVLDTANSDAERLYIKYGWQYCGEIPNFALMPDGQPCTARIYFKHIHK